MNKPSPEIWSELERESVLTTGERKGITRLYRDAANEHSIDQGFPPEWTDDVPGVWGVVNIQDKIRIGPIEYWGMVDEEGIVIPEFWVIHVDDDNAPASIRNTMITIRNEELPVERRVCPPPLDAVQPDASNQIIALSEDQKSDLLGYMRRLPHGDVLREHT